MSAFFFDLDGTLLDTAADIATTLNIIQKEEGITPSCTRENVFPLVSQGGPALIKLAFGIEPNTPQYTNLRQRVLDTYNTVMFQDTVLFPGIATLLSTLTKKNITWGVISNKLEVPTRALLAHFNLADFCCCIIGGDTYTHRKPHPMQLERAAQIVGLSTKQCVYVGDAKNDIIAASRAGMNSIVADFGYTPSDANTWGADAIAAAPNDILIQGLALTQLTQ